MTLQDLGFWIATTAAVVGAFYTALTYHRQKVPPVQPNRRGGANAKPQAHIQNRRPIAVLTALLVIAWGVVAYDYVDRHWLNPQHPAELPIEPKNAHLEKFDLTFLSQTTPPQDYANIRFKNAGQLSVEQFRHIEVLQYTKIALLEENIAPIFASFYSGLSFNKEGSKTELPGGSDDFWFTVFGPELDKEQQESVKSPDIYRYIFIVIRYKDRSLEEGQYIYTEICNYYFRGAVHYCDSGHNRTYIGY